ncbi:hypothetical protein KAH94_03555 [bacterium]|nr:hypothetical protein [bacterium]
MINKNSKTIFSIMFVSSLLTANLAQSSYFHPKTVECSLKQWDPSWTKKIKKILIIEPLKLAAYSTTFVTLSYFKPKLAKNLFSSFWGGKDTAKYTCQLTAKACALLKGQNFKPLFLTRANEVKEEILQNVKSCNYGPMTRLNNYIQKYPSLATEDFCNKETNNNPSNYFIDYFSFDGDLEFYELPKKSNKYEKWSDL